MSMSVMPLKGIYPILSAKTREHPELELVSAQSVVDADACRKG